MAEGMEMLAKLASLVCDDDEVDALEVRDGLCDCLTLDLLDPMAGPEAVSAMATRAAMAGIATVRTHPSDAPRIAWELAQQGLPCATCAVLGYPMGRALSDALCFESALLMSAGVAELELVANTGAFVEGSLDDVAEPIMSVLRTVSDDEDECGDECGCGHDHGDECGCGHHHHDEECDDGCGCGEAPSVKVVLECPCLGAEELCRACDMVSSMGVDAVVACTGAGERVATAENLRLMCATVEPGVRVEACCDAASLADVAELLEVGCNRIATPFALQVLGEFDALAVELGLLE